jgi:hypothetical protein
VPDKRLLFRATAVLIVGATFLTGCGSHQRAAQPAPPAATVKAPAPASVSPSPAAPGSAGSSGSSGSDLDNADNLLQQVDGQVSAADQTPNDAD